MPCLIFKFYFIIGQVTKKSREPLKQCVYEQLCKTFERATKNLFVHILRRQQMFSKIRRLFHRLLIKFMESSLIDPSGCLHHNINERFVAAAAYVDAEGVLCALKQVVSIPALPITVLIHRATVSLQTGLYGLLKLNRSWSSLSLTWFVMIKYCFRQVTTQSSLSAGYALKTNG